MSSGFSYSPIEKPLTTYVPFESLTEPVIRSIIAVACRHSRESWNFSQRTLLAFLLAINEQLTKTEKESDAHAIKIRQWLVNKKNEPLDWDTLRQEYDTMKTKKHDEMARYFGTKNTDRYFELTMPTKYDDVEQSRQYMAKFRKEGFKPEEIKLYWNDKQLENLCPNEEDSPEALPPHDPSDIDAIENLRKHPVEQRKHPGTITYIHGGIEKAVFNIPEDAQIIVLNFANEQSPGGGYLRHAKAQEEVILYNSDAFRALLDLKYGRMADGYAIPEYGLAYIRNIRFFDPDSDKTRLADMMVSACYCMSGQELYKNPQSLAEWKEKNLAKFRAFMAAAVANTVGDGSKTYLLLGPIGTGAFGNDVKRIGEVFHDVLKLKMMHSEQPIRQAFGNIWFVSTDKWKNDDFAKIIIDDEMANVEGKSNVE